MLKFLLLKKGSAHNCIHTSAEKVRFRLLLVTINLNYYSIVQMVPLFNARCLDHYCNCNLSLMDVHCDLSLMDLHCDLSFLHLHLKLKFFTCLDLDCD